MPLARDLHPEFGYVGSAPRLCRKLGLVLAFLMFGFVAALSGLAVFIPAPEPDPMHAMALAPAEALIGGKAAKAVVASEPVPLTQTMPAQKGDREEERNKTAAIRPGCRDSAADQGGCMFPRPMKARPAQALNERPAIAAVPIGRIDEPAILPPSEPAPPVAAAPAAEDASTNPQPAAEAPPAQRPAAKKSHARSRSQGREAYAPSRSYSRSYTPAIGGYAGVY